MKNKFILPLITSLFFASCKKEETYPPGVNTGYTENLKSTSVLIANSHASASDNDPIVQQGVCWGLNANPTLSNDFTIDGSVNNAFESSLLGLQPSTTYYFRAYATNSKGVTYGDEKSFKTFPAISTVPGAGVQMDGYNYQTVVFGNGQEWMAENLRTTKYANGNSIPNVTDNNQWSNLTTGAWSHYNNDSQLENPYGKLYNFYAVEDARNVCPTGWHVPSMVEWNALIDYLGGDSIAGYRMKHDNVEYWPNDPTWGFATGTNESGLSIVCAYRRNADGSFLSGVYDYPQSSLWSSTTFQQQILGTTFTYAYDIHFNWKKEVFPSETGEGSGLKSGKSIRCIKN